MISDDINLSIKIILRNKFRTFTATIGIVIGVSLLIVTFSLLKIGEIKFLADIDKIGKNIIKINTINSDEYLKYYFNFEDIKSLKNSSLSINSISPEAYFKGTISNEFDNLASYVIGGTEDYKDFMMMDMIKGRFFSRHECANKENVIIIDNVTSNNLFGTDDSINKEVYIGNSRRLHKYKVIGVIKHPSNIWEMNDNLVSFSIIPISTYIRDFNRDPFFDYLYISLNNKKDMSMIGDSIINFLKVKNNITKDIYKVENFLRSEDRINDINNLIVKIIRVVGYIFIIISGINITNVMLFNVNNRINEIGLRRISGANKYDIFIQFVTESSILSLIGGIVGVFLGSMITFFLGNIINENISINFLNLFGFLIISLITGVVFGLFPAVKACNINLSDIFNNE